jgi:hypothetical protein
MPANALKTCVQWDGYEHTSAGDRASGNRADHRHGVWSVAGRKGNGAYDVDSGPRAWHDESVMGDIV